MDQERNIRLHFEGPKTAGHTLPAQTLVRSMENVQRIIYLLAKLTRGEALGQRARFNHELERVYSLVCKVPEDGGYALPQVIGDDSQGLFDATEISAVAEKFKKVCLAIEGSDVQSLRSLLPDGGYRSAILKSYKAAQPQKRSGIVLSIEDFRKKPILSGIGISAKIEAIEAAEVEHFLGETPGYLTGTLTRMDFVERWLQLKLFNGRTIQASYANAYEPVLLENARDIIQIHGDIQLSADGEPIAVQNVDEVVELDISDAVVKYFDVSDVRIEVTPPVIFEVQFDEESSLLSAQGDFGIIVFAETRSALEDEIDEALRMLWLEYADEDAEKLSGAARLLKSSLIARFKRAE